MVAEQPNLMQLYNGTRPNISAFRLCSRSRKLSTMVEIIKTPHLEWQICFSWPITDVQIFTGISQKSRVKAGNRIMVRSFLSCQEPREVDVPAACGFELSGRIDALGISISQDLEHSLWVHCRISALPWTAGFSEPAFLFSGIKVEPLFRR